MSQAVANTEAISVRVVGDLVHTTIRRPATVPSPPIAPASLIDPASSDAIHFPLHRLLAADGGALTFETDLGKAGSTLTPSPGKPYALQSWWTPAQLQLARSGQTRWRRTLFQARDAISFEAPEAVPMQAVANTEVPPDASVIPGGWDHEHCSLCWASISPAQDEEATAYTDGSAWLCVSCHCEYIASGFGTKLG
jgi:hypothetical protein